MQRSMLKSLCRILAAAVSLQVVVQVQLCHIGCIGRWNNYCRHSHLSHLTITGPRQYRRVCPYLSPCTFEYGTDMYVRVWWGNTVYQNTLDWAGVPYKTPPGEGFGPTTWAA